MRECKVVKNKTITQETAQSCWNRTAQDHFEYRSNNTNTQTTASQRLKGEITKEEQEVTSLPINVENVTQRYILTQENSQ